MGTVERLDKGARHVHRAKASTEKGFGKQKELNEMSDWSIDVWDINGCHARTASPPHAESTACGCTRTRSTVLARCQPLTARNRVEALAVTDETLDVQQKQLGEKGFTEAPQDGEWFDSVFPRVQDRALRKQDSLPRGKFTNRCKLRAHGESSLGETAGRRTVRRGQVGRPSS